MVRGLKIVGVVLLFGLGIPLLFPHMLEDLPWSLGPLLFATLVPFGFSILAKWWETVDPRHGTGRQGSEEA